MNSKCKPPRAVDYDDGGRVFIAMNDDMLTEILDRLPAKSVTIFKSVCKHWLSLISSDQFCRLHTLRRHKPQPSLLLHIFASGFFYINPIIDGEQPMMIPYNINVPNFKIWSSCNISASNVDILSSGNGLLLLQCDNPPTNYYVYNPTTKQSRKVIVNHDSKYSIKVLKLAFDPSKSPDYKIFYLRGKSIMTPLYEILFSYQIEVYDSESRIRNLCSDSFPDSKDPFFSSGAYCYNSIYWKNLGATMCFDIDKNAIGSLPPPKIPWPVQPEDAFIYSQLQESNGHVYYLLINREGESVALWELQRDDHYQWFLK